MIGYWIQRHNYSSETISESSLAQTLKAYEDFDWESELNKFQENVEGMDCPPGIGINNGESLDKEGSFLLHICPIDERMAYFNYHYQKLSNFFGLNLGTTAEIHYVAKYARSKIPNLIELFYAGKHKQVLEVE